VAATKQQPISTEYPDENIARMLRRFTSQHTTLLGWAGFQALQLKRVPSNVRQSALLIELTPRPSSDSNRQYVFSPLSFTPPCSESSLSLTLQVPRQGHTHRPPHARHLTRPARGSRYPAPRGALPACRWDRHCCGVDPVWRSEPGDAGRSRPAGQDFVGRAERLGTSARALCRFRSGGL
jgi:hypothetical protein